MACLVPSHTLYMNMRCAYAVQMCDVVLHSVPTTLHPNYVGGRLGMVGGVARARKRALKDCESIFVASLALRRVETIGRCFCSIAFGAAAENPFLGLYAACCSMQVRRGR